MGWQEIYKNLQDNNQVTLKILVGLQDDSLNQEEHFAHFMKSMGVAINNAEMDNKSFYNQIAFLMQLLE